MATQPVVDLGSTPFLDRMPRESRDQILVNSTKIRYAAGTIAFQPGDPDRADILENGFARLYLTSSGGRQTTIRYVHPGELMGGMLVMGAVFDGSVQMIVDSTVIHLDLLTVRRRVDIDPAAGSALAADLAQRIYIAFAQSPFTRSGRSCNVSRSTSWIELAEPSFRPGSWRPRSPSRRSPTVSARPDQWWRRD